MNEKEEHLTDSDRIDLATTPVQKMINEGEGEADKMIHSGF